MSPTARSGATSGSSLTPRAVRSGLYLALVAVPLLASTAAASDLRLSVTDTLMSEYRADNGNSNPDDDNYGVFVNRLTLVASAGNLTTSQRIDLVQFVDPPTLDHVSEIIPERITLRYRMGDFRVTAGDFYRQLGRGIALAIRKVDELGLDVSLRGGQMAWAGDAMDVSLFGGITNSVNLDSVSQKHIEDPDDIVAGGVTEISIVDGFRVGAYGLYLQPEETVGDQTDRVATGGGTVEVQLMDSDLVIYAEGVGQHRETVGVTDVGYAGYLSADLSLGDWTLLVESLFMEAFEQQGSSNTGAGGFFNYSNAPTLERFDQEVVNNRDVAGLRARVETSLLDGDLRLHISGMYRSTDPTRETARVDQIHGFAGGEYLWDHGDSRLAGSAGYRREVQVFTDFEIKTMTHFDVDYLQRLTGLMSLHVTSVNELRSLAGNPYKRGSFFLGLDWAQIGGVTFEFGYDDQNQSPGVRNLFYAGIGAWHVTDRMQLRATVGTQRGGIKCIAGVCRDFPAFTGGRLEAVGRF